MSNQLLEAPDFEYILSYFNAKFEEILSKIIVCYNLMIADEAILPNDENKIRDELVNNYLNNPRIKESIQLTNLYFQPETPENTGRVDVKIISDETLRDGGKSYYIIECKRLNAENQNGKTGLNGEYISNGIARFVSGKYSMYNNIAGMIGFVVSKMDICANVCCINKLLQNTFTEINTEKQLTKKQITPDFEYSYYSNHKVGKSTKIIYHLMFDFSANIIDIKTTTNILWQTN
jgi:hypothetical protein